jgi:hypothetical protein
MTQLLETTPAAMPTARGLLSVIIPILNEADRLPAVLKRLGAADVEVIVADGGSTDDSIAIARRHNVTIVQSEPGRDKQMNAGAAASSGETLIFLHADTHLPEGFDTQVAAALKRPGIVAGAFRFQLDDRRPTYRWLSY